MQALLDNGDEILIPAPDYPLWTASVNLCGGKPIHYICDEQSHWQPDLEDIKSKITKHTKGIVIINPNNPTGAVYQKETIEKMIEIAREHKLIIFSDEIYDKIIYDGTEHVSPASLVADLLVLTFNGLSKNYRAAGFRTGWMIVSGNKTIARDYIEGLEILASMRLCSNVPTQFAVQTSLGGYQSIYDLTKPGGRLYEQMELSHKMLSEIPGITCVKPKGALYCFPKLDINKFNIKDDRKFVLDLLLAEKVLLVQGTGFNWPTPDHFRMVFLPRTDMLAEAISRLGHFLSYYRQ
jgi:alanine-synthesizing transaminase